MANVLSKTPKWHMAADIAAIATLLVVAFLIGAGVALMFTSGEHATWMTQ